MMMMVMMQPVQATNLLYEECNVIIMPIVWKMVYVKNQTLASNKTKCSQPGRFVFYPAGSVVCA
jgi:hypothetical protein